MTSEEEIRAAVRDYLEGMVFADADRIRLAFHPDARSIGHYRGVLEWDSVEQFAAACVAAGALPVGSDFYWKILSLEVTGDMAAVKLEDDYQGSRFTDYLTLLRVDGRWKIVAKVFFDHG